MATPPWPSSHLAIPWGQKLLDVEDPGGYLGTVIISIQCPILPQTNWISPGPQSLDTRPDTRDGVGGVTVWEWGCKATRRLA